MLEQLREDFETHGRQLGHPGLWVMAVYRFGRVALSLRWAPLRVLATLAYKLLYVAVRAASGVQLPASVRVGRRFRIDHGGGVVIHAQAEFGDDVAIQSGVTVGVKRRGEPGVPVIGNRVYLGTGAKILGAVHVGDDVTVGANAVVIRDVPAGCIAVGVPAEVRPGSAHVAEGASRAPSSGRG